jgi:DNA-binding response OmpR family regulator
MAAILLIEPDKVLAEIYSHRLTANGHKVSFATGAQSAVHEADQMNPDLIVLELQLVEHSGIEFLYELRSYPDWQGIPVIVHSQVPQSEFIDNFELLKTELGVTAYLYKPQTSLKELAQTVDQQLALAA